MIKLNIGGNEKLSGGRNSDPLENYINLDIRPLENVHIVQDIRQSLPFKDDSVDIIRAAHVLEHLEPKAILPVLTEWYRVLKDDGELHVYVPDGDKIIDAYKSGILLCTEMSGHLLGKQDYIENVHRAIFTTMKLTNVVTAVGFKVISHNQRNFHSDEYQFDLGIQVKKAVS